MEYNFKRKVACTELVNFMRKWYKETSDGCNVVIGISGGKDSSVVAALCCEAFGKDKVIGVLIPNGEQSDIDVARDLCKTLDIKNVTINIRCAYDSILAGLDDAGIEITNQTKWNLPPRLRMSTLYAVAQSCNGRVINTSNLSEDWVGWATRWGDSVGDVMPLALLTVQEVKEIGYELGLDKRFIEKAPADGLVGVTDEEKLGFKYETLDRYLRTGEIKANVGYENIEKRHKNNLFKLVPVSMYRPSYEALYDEGFEVPPIFRDGRNEFAMASDLVPLTPDVI